jgi:hypothetical protein
MPAHRTHRPAAVLPARSALAALSVLAAVAVGAAGCERTGTQPGQPRSSYATSHAQPGWREPAHYAFTLDSRCGERPLIGRFGVVVDGGRVVSARALDGPAGTALAASGSGALPTLGQLADRYTAARQRGEDAQADFDRSDGHPLRVTFDPRPAAIDDEECYTITDYVAG